MDWSKAKNVMIIALLITNVFLLYLFFEKYYEKVETADTPGIIRVLEEHNIRMKTKIPDVRAKLPVISLSYTLPDTEIIDEKLSYGNFRVKEKKDLDGYKALSDKFMEKIGFSLADFVTGEIKKEGDIVKVPYFSTFDGYVIEDEPLFVVFEKGKLIGLRGKLTIGMPAVKKHIPVMSAKEALLLFMSEEAGQNSQITINDIKMVFWVNNDNLDEENLVLDTAFPAWKITYDKDKVKYILANRG